MRKVISSIQYPEVLTWDEAIKMENSLVESFVVIQGDTKKWYAGRYDKTVRICGNKAFYKSTCTSWISYSKGKFYGTSPDWYVFKEILNYFDCDWVTKYMQDNPSFKAIARNKHILRSIINKNITSPEQAYRAHMRRTYHVELPWELYAEFRNRCFCTISLDYVINFTTSPQRALEIILRSKNFRERDLIIESIVLARKLNTKFVPSTDMHEVNKQYNRFAEELGMTGVKSWEQLPF